MTRLYQKDERLFSLVWIGLYVLGLSMGHFLSPSPRADSPTRAIVCAAMAAALVGWIVRNGLRGKYGLIGVRGDLQRFFYFLPLIVIASANLWGGLAFNLPLSEALWGVVALLCASVAEEILFRGFLFRALYTKHVPGAAILSSAAFALMHALNFFNGAPTLAILLQIGYAGAIGYLLAVLAKQSKSLIPGMIAHGVLNMTSLWAREPAMNVQLIMAGTVICISLLYAQWLLRKYP